jgi:hypothetical protein
MHGALELVRVDDGRDHGGAEEHPGGRAAVFLDLLFLGGGSELDGERGRVDEVREGQGRVEGSLARGEEEQLEGPEPGEEEGGGAAERGGREGKRDGVEEHDDGKERREAGRARAEARRGEARVGHCRPRRRGDLHDAAELAVHQRRRHADRMTSQQKLIPLLRAL